MSKLKKPTKGKPAKGLPMLQLAAQEASESLASGDMKQTAKNLEALSGHFQAEIERRRLPLKDIDDQGNLAIGALRTFRQLPEDSQTALINAGLTSVAGHNSDLMERGPVTALAVLVGFWAVRFQGGTPWAQKGAEWRTFDLEAAEKKLDWKPAFTAEAHSICRRLAVGNNMILAQIAAAHARACLDYLNQDRWPHASDERDALICALDLIPSNDENQNRAADELIAAADESSQDLAIETLKSLLAAMTPGENMRAPVFSRRMVASLWRHAFNQAVREAQADPEAMKEGVIGLLNNLLKGRDSEWAQNRGGA